MIFVMVLILIVVLFLFERPKQSGFGEARNFHVFCGEPVVIEMGRNR